MSRLRPLALPAFALLVLFRLALAENSSALKGRAAWNRITLCRVASAAIICLTLALSGCGGGSTSVAPPPPTVTPSGTFPLTIAPSRNSSAGQPLQLPPVQLTLIVK